MLSTNEVQHDERQDAVESCQCNLANDVLAHTSSDFFAHLDELLALALRNEGVSSVLDGLKRSGEVQGQDHNNQRASESVGYAHAHCQCATRDLADVGRISKELSYLSDDLVDIDEASKLGIDQSNPVFGLQGGNFCRESVPQRNNLIHHHGDNRNKNSSNSTDYDDDDRQNCGPLGKFLTRQPLHSGVETQREEESNEDVSEDCSQRLNCRHQHNAEANAQAAD